MEPFLNTEGPRGRGGLHQTGREWTYRVGA